MLASVVEGQSKAFEAKTARTSSSGANDPTGELRAHYATAELKEPLIKAERYEETKSPGRDEEGIYNQVDTSTATVNFKSPELSLNNAPIADNVLEAKAQPPPTCTTSNPNPGGYAPARTADNIAEAETSTMSGNQTDYLQARTADILAEAEAIARSGNPSDYLRARAANNFAEVEAITRRAVSPGPSWAVSCGSTRPYSPPRYSPSTPMEPSAERTVHTPPQTTSPRGAGAPLSSRVGGMGQSPGAASSRPRTPIRGRSQTHEALHNNLDALEGLTQSLLGALNSKVPSQSAHFIGTPREGSPR